MMSREVVVSLGERSYRVVVRDLSDWDRQSAPELTERGSNAVLVTDTNVGPLWADKVARSLTGLGLKLQEIRIPAGEASKVLATVERIYDILLDEVVKRDGWVIALGGVVVGDLAGFAAATYLRGVALLQVPTSLLAMVDASVGGKVGVDYAGGKNLVGTFHQPRLVLTSAGFLSTLPDREFANGLAEVIKAAIIGDPSLFALMEARAAPIWERDSSVLEELIGRSVEVKARIVEKDERETGYRQILNLGHTIGHALEAAAGFSNLGHGEAVAVGLVAACQLSFLLGLLPAAQRDRVERLLALHRLPTRLPNVRWQEVEPWLRLDKKGRETGGTYVLTAGIGDVSVHRQVPEHSVREAAAYVLV